jgi:hypothetical protein
VTGDVVRHSFVTVVTSVYDDPVWPALPRTSNEVAALCGWLCDEQLGDRRFHRRYEHLVANPTKQQIRDAFENPPAGQRWNHEDAVVLFVSGHGTAEEDDTHYLILKETDSARLRSTALRSVELIGWLIDTDVHHLLLIVDACYAGKVAADTFRFSKNLPAHWLVLPSATKGEQAFEGALTRAITSFLAELASREGLGRQEERSPYLKVEDFLEEVQKHLAPGQSLVPLYGSQVRGPHLCLPNPNFKADSVVTVAAARHDLALPKTDLDTHWGPRSRGVATPDDPGWLFTGRAELMQTLIAAATGPPHATVCTGGAGSGKSAALARLVTLSDPTFIEQHTEDLADVPVSLRPPPGVVDVAVVATGKIRTQVLAQICHALDVPAPSSGHAEPSIAERLIAWHTWLAARDQPITVVVDALDEASDPHALVTEVLSKLDPDPRRRKVRLLVGVRSVGGPNAPTAVAAAGPPLADLTVRALNATRVQVDEEPWWNRNDVTAYAHSILRHTAGSPYPGAGPKATAAVAHAIGERAGRSFLVARVAAAALVHHSTAIAADDTRWLTALDEGVVGVFRMDLHQSLPGNRGGRHRAVTLLRALAFSQGSGLPWRRIWPRVATAIDDGDYDYGDGDIAWLLDSRLGAYLVTDVEDGATVYRPFHDALRTILRDGWRHLLAPDVDSVGRGVEEEYEATQRAITEVLLVLAYSHRARNVPPPAYVRRYLAVHAHAGRVLDGRVIHPRLLPYLDTTRLWQFHELPTTLPEPQAALLNVLRGVALSWNYDTPEINAATLAMALVERDMSAADLAPELDWCPEWANWVPTAAVPVGSTPTVTAVLPDGRVVAASESRSGESDVRDLASGQTVGEPLHGSAVGAAQLRDGRAVVLLETEVGDSRNRSVHVCDLSSRARLAKPIPGRLAATAVLPDRRAVAVVTTGHDVDARSEVWDLERVRPTGTTIPGFPVASVTTATGRPLLLVRVGERLQVRDVENGALLCILPDAIDPDFWHGRACVVATGQGRTVIVYQGKGATRAWDVLSGAPVREPLVDEILDAAATAPLQGGGTGMVVADERWRFVDAKDGRRLETIAASGLRPVVHLPPDPDGDVQHCDRIGGLGPFLRLPDGRDVAVTHTYSSVMRDLRYIGSDQSNTVRRVGTPRSPATLGNGRRVMLCTSTETGLVHILDLRTGEEVGPPFEAHARENLRGYTHAHDAKAAVLASGRRVALSGGADGAWLWDLDTREPIRKLYESRRHGVGRVDVVATRDGRVLGVVGSQRADVAVYDLQSTEEVGQSSWPLGSGEDCSISAIATAVDGRGIPLAVVSNYFGSATVFDLRTNDPVRELVLHHPLPHGRSSIAAAIARGGEMYVLLGIEVWRMSTDAWDSASTRRVGFLEADPDGKQAVRLLSLSSGDVVAVALDGDGWVRAYAIPDGHQIGSAFSTLGKAFELYAEPDDAVGARLLLFGHYGWASVTWSRRS